MQVRVDIKPFVGARVRANNMSLRFVDDADICCMIAC
jgi:hypothetical protein